MFQAVHEGLAGGHVGRKRTQLELNAVDTGLVGHQT